MGRRIVVCVDGTNNAPGDGMTNVQRLNRILQRSEEQIVYYQPGVGTVEPTSMSTPWGRRALMVLDSISAVMLRRHVCSAYRYLMGEYRNGDTIYAFGFSRGAYAVRVLAGMLRKVGLLQRGLEEMVDFAWRAYAQHGNHEAADEFRNAYGRYVPSIHFLGLFDTVSAVGSPWRPTTFDYTFANDHVEIVRHALALDEHRAMFVQNLWREPTPEDPPTKHSTNVRQVWFAGVHADIGGGYPEAERGLSLIPLAWMRDQAEQAGLIFRPKLTARLFAGADDATTTAVTDVVDANAGAKIHDELQSHRAWHLLEWLPIPRWRPDERGGWERRWRVHAGRARDVPEESLVHTSVGVRKSRLSYRPRPALANIRDEPPATPDRPTAPQGEANDISRLMQALPEEFLIEPPDDTQGPPRA